MSEWSEVAEDARKRDSFQLRRQQFLESLPRESKMSLRKMSTDAGTSTVLPTTSRSQRADEEERSVSNTSAPALARSRACRLSLVACRLLLIDCRLSLVAY